MEPLRRFISTMPALLYLMTVLLSGCWGFFHEEIPLILRLVPPFIFIFLVGITLDYKKALVCAFFAVISLGSLHLMQSPDVNHYESHFPQGKGRCQIQCVINEKLLPPLALQPHIEQPYLIQAQILNIRKRSVDSWEKTTGNVMLKIPQKLSLDSIFSQLCYNDTLSLSGELRYPKDPLFKQGFNMRRFLSTRDAPMIFYIEEHINDSQRIIQPLNIRILEPILALRDHLLVRMTKGLSEAHQQLLSALCFGYKQSIQAQSKQDFSRIGIIHIFAVSGLHIALFAFIFISLLRPIPMPIMIRNVLLILLTLMYMISTGAQISSFRAWIMFSIFMLCYALYKRTNNLNTLLLIASLFLAFQIQWLFDIGFLYSFAACIFLILSWECVSQLNRIFHAHEKWVPYRYQKKRFSPSARRIKDYFFRAFMSSSIAVAATSPISSYSMGYFSFIAIFLNMLLLPVVFILFSFAMVKMLFGFLFFNYILSVLLDLICSICTYAVDYFETGSFFTSFSVIELLLFWLLIILLLKGGSRYRKCFIFILFALITIMTFFQLFPFEQKTKVFLFSGGENKGAALLILSPSQSLSMMINTQDIRIVWEVPKILFQNHFASLSHLVITDRIYASSRAANALLIPVKIRTVIHPKMKKLTYALEAIHQQHLPNQTQLIVCEEKQGFWKYDDAQIQLHRTPTHLTIKTTHFTFVLTDKNLTINNQTYPFYTGTKTECQLISF